jgi:hypothetical protein
VETWEKFQARLFHLGYLAEELPAFVARPPAAWLYRQIAREADAVARIAAAYVAEAGRAKLTTAPPTTVLLTAEPASADLAGPDGFTDAETDAFTAEAAIIPAAAMTAGNIPAPGAGGDAR